MGDVGTLDDQGRLWFCGRKSQRVRTSNGDLYADQCEGVFNALPSIHRTALVGIGSPGGQRPVLCVESPPPPDNSTDPRRLHEAAEAHPATARILDFLFHPGFPVDTRHNAKIQREKLAAWAAKRLGGR